MTAGRPNSKTQNPKSAFTLVELLVVITIIGILIGLLLPAVQAAREAARSAQCMNHIRQMAMASLHHVEAQGHFPTGGWGYWFAGDPDRGFNHRQPSGWHYNILPYLEMESLHQLGAGLTGEAKRDAISQRIRTPVSIFHCPSRRRATPYEHIQYRYPVNATWPPVMGRNDYAACGGDMANAGSGAPAESLAQGDGWSEDRWNQMAGTHNDATGVNDRRSEIQIAHIRDGTSNTYLLGEKYLDPDWYFAMSGAGDDQGWDQGYDYDTMRWSDLAPRRDTQGYGGLREFGSAHPTGFHMALCDGSVHRLSYAIDRQVHKRLGHRASGQPIPGDALR